MPIKRKPLPSPEALNAAYLRGIELREMYGRYQRYFETGRSPYATLLSYPEWIALPPNQRPGGPE